VRCKHLGAGFPSGHERIAVDDREQDHDRDDADLAVEQRRGHGRRQRRRPPVSAMLTIPVATISATTKWALCCGILPPSNFEIAARANAHDSLYRIDTIQDLLRRSRRTALSCGQSRFRLQIRYG
jgi:hypothetical protein